MADRNAEMSITEFEDLAAAYGPDPAHWPEGHRAAAEALLAGPDGDAAQAALALARDLDAALADLAAAEPTPALPDALTARILTDAATISAERAPRPQALRATAPKSRSWLADLAETFGGWRMAGASMAMMAVIGLGLGYASPDNAASALGFQSAAQEETVVDLGWDVGPDAAEFAVFGGAG